MYIVMELCEKDQVLSYFIKSTYKKGKFVTERDAIMILDNVL